MPTLKEFIDNIPKVSRILLVSSAILTLLTSLDAISQSDLLVSWTLIRREPWQIYRVPISMVYLGKFSIMWPFSFLQFLQHLSGVENSLGVRRFCGYFITAMIMISLTTIFYMPMPLLSTMFTMFTLYYWARLNKDSSVNIYNVISVPCGTLPWLMALLARLVTGSCRAELTAIALGHTYWWTTDVLTSLIGWSPVVWFEEMITALPAKIGSKRPTAPGPLKPAAPALNNPWAAAGRGRRLNE